MKKIIILFSWLCLLWIVVGNAYGSEPDHSFVPGVVIDYSPASTEIYIGCPSIAVLPDGSYVASHSFFGPGSTQNRSCVFKSLDNGETWLKLSDLDGQWWSTLFVHDGDLYIMGVNRRYGQAVIRRSRDGGRTWTNPLDEHTGLLLPEEEHHCAPVPVVLFNGRIWRAMEDRNPPEGWGINFRSFVMSAPADADLLEAKNWTTSNRLRYNQDWPGSAWLEGNIVVTPEGKVCNIIRNHTETGGKAAVIQVSDDGKTMSFDPETGFIDFPGGSKKFTIRYDIATGKYWSLTNYIRDCDKGGDPNMTRNTLALISSSDLKNWTVNSILLYHPDVEKTGFQYVDWLFAGDDIIAVSRTAFDDGIGGAHNCHDANYFTFHRVKNFRKRTMDDPLLK
ncbi:MAG: exo-alpha-sialidase [Candidatus Latescibacteria bacterium]|nr:exo-alpha-sialidase [Candidatus Latescibacterota bacterium]